MSKQTLNYEQSVARLEQVVARLEQGEVPLEEALALFEEGTTLIRCCSSALDQAEQKVMKLVPGPNGTPVAEEMEEMSQ